VATLPSASPIEATLPRWHAAETEPFSVSSFGVLQKPKLVGGDSTGPEGLATRTVAVIASPGFTSAGSIRTPRTIVRSTKDSRSSKSGRQDARLAAEPQRHRERMKDLSAALRLRGRFGLVCLIAPASRR
jgi:hypothetical protein